jgi:hypothetical protein
MSAFTQRRILSVVSPEPTDIDCPGCGRLVPHVWLTAYSRDSDGDLISGRVASPCAHRAPCGRQCSRGPPCDDHLDGDPVHFAEACSSRHPRPRE